MVETTHQQRREVRERSRIEDVTRQEAVNRQLRDEVAALRQREHLKVKGVGPQWAEALAHAIARLNEGKVRVTGSNPPVATVSRWVRAAGRRNPRIP